VAAVGAGVAVGIAAGVWRALAVARELASGLGGGSGEEPVRATDAGDAVERGRDEAAATCGDVSPATSARCAAGGDGSCDGTLFRGVEETSGDGSASGELVSATAGASVGSGVGFSVGAGVTRSKAGDATAMTLCSEDEARRLTSETPAPITNPKMTTPSKIGRIGSVASLLRRGARRERRGGSSDIAGAISARAPHGLAEKMFAFATRSERA